jgi:hypothetical protein
MEAGDVDASCLFFTGTLQKTKKHVSVVMKDDLGE